MLVWGCKNPRCRCCFPSKVRGNGERTDGLNLKQRGTVTTGVAAAGTQSEGATTYRWQIQSIQLTAASSAAFLKHVFSFFKKQSSSCVFQLLMPLLAAVEPLSPVVALESTLSAHGLA